jgi:hypothetical protein
MAVIEIEGSVHESFVEQYPDPQIRQQIATMQIAKLLEPLRKKPKLLYTTVALSDEMRDWLNKKAEEAGVKRRQLLNEMIWNANVSEMREKTDAGHGYYQRNEQKAELGLKNASFSPDQATYNQWAALADELKMSKQLVLEHLVQLEMNKDQNQGSNS